MFEGFDRRIADDVTVEQVYDAALAAARRIETEPEFSGKLTFDPREFQVIWNDRLLYPNTHESWTTVRPEVESFLASRFGKYKLMRIGESRERLRAEVTA